MVKLNNLINELGWILEGCDLVPWKHIGKLEQFWSKFHPSLLTAVQLILGTDTGLHHQRNRECQLTNFWTIIWVFPQQDIILLLAGHCLETLPNLLETHTEIQEGFRGQLDKD